jgi:hypothetical protein
VSAKASAKKSAKKAQTMDPAELNVVNHYGFNGFPNGDWRSATNPALMPMVSRVHALAEGAFDSFSRIESDLLPCFDREKFTNFYEFCRDKTLEFSLASFTEFSDIAKANRNLVPEDPTWWAHAQTHALLCQVLGVPKASTDFRFWRLRRWIRYFCDGKIPVYVIDDADLETTEGFLGIVTGSDWRAPKWLWAWAKKYFGGDSVEWDSLKTEAAAMEQLDQQKTEKLLDAITKRFWLDIEYRFSEHVARVSVDDARTGLTLPAVHPVQSPGQSPAIVPSPTTAAPRAVVAQDPEVSRAKDAKDRKDPELLAARVARKRKDPIGNPLMTVEEVAFAFSVRKSSIYRWVAEGKRVGPGEIQLTWSAHGKISTELVQRALGPPPT